MTVTRLVFLSDIHIGTGAVTNWYQPRFHEPMLTAALEWVIAHAGTIDELVLLGDVVDQWTFVPDVRPPTFAEIAAANPGIFAPRTGALARAVAALAGRVTWVPGNHDMAVGADDVATIVDDAGRHPRFVTDFPYVPAAGGGDVACAHGHQFSVFNAPDHQAMPATGLPVGHVVTRLASLWSAQRLGKGETVADRPGAGEPTGWVFEKEELRAALVGVIEGKDALPQLVVSALLDATGQPATVPITMLDGSTTTAGALVTAYGDLYHRFADAAHFPGAGYGVGARFFALMDTDMKNALGHFAAELGKHHKMVVLGHTHSPEDAHERLLLGPSSLYANSGFGCPAIPDALRPLSPRRPTFVVVERDDVARTITAQVYAVAPDGDRGLVLEPPGETASIAL